MGKAMSSNARPYATGGLARYRNPPVSEPVRRASAALRSDHAALSEGRSIFPGSVFDVDQRDRVLTNGINNAKIGRRVTVGRWAGMRIFTLSLEERATCPRTCAVWSECYGNGMPLAARMRYTPELMVRLDEELAILDDKYRRGFVVRLHVLGDIPDALYLRHWETWMAEFPALHVWGYTAHAVDSSIGMAVGKMNADYIDRWSVRFSVAPELPQLPMQASAVWTTPDQTSLRDGALVCPQEIGKTQTCGTCGICWKPELSDIRILFYGHSGGRGRKVTSV